MPGPTGLGIIRRSAGVPLNCGLILSNRWGPPQVEVEAQHVEQFQVSVPGHDIEATRREQKLVLDYVSHLKSLGHGVARHRYPLQGVRPGTCV